MAQVGAANFTSANMTVTDAAGKIVNLSYVNVTLTPFGRPDFFPGCMPPPNDTLAGVPANETQNPLRPLRQLDQPSDRPQLPPGASAPPTQPLPFARGGGSRPQDGSLPLNGSFPLNGSLPFGGTLRFNGSRPVDGPLLPNGSLPLNGFGGLPAARVDISILLGVDEELTIMYGTATVVVPNGTGSNGESTLALTLADAYNVSPASLAFLPYALESQDGGIKMHISLTIEQGNATNGSASHTTVHMQLPNPQNYNQTSIYYDPTSTTTSAYLATTDTSNIDVSTLVATTHSATDTSATSSSSTSSGLSDGAKIGIIAGCAVGGAVLIAGAMVAAVVAKRRREGFNKVVAMGPEST